MNQRGWLVVYWALFLAFLGTAALNMLHVRGGFLTNHAADLIVPAWLYVVFRGIYSKTGRQSLIQRTLGRTPERAALGLFLASTLTEVSQFYWPRGVFSGRFDTLHILAYAVGLAICYVTDKRFPGGALCERNWHRLLLRQPGGNAVTKAEQIEQDVRCVGQP